MRVAAEVFDHLLWPAKGRLGVDDPFDVGQRGDLRTKRCRVAQAGEVAEKLQLIALVRLFERFKKQTAEEARQHFNGKKETRPAVDPALPVARQSAASNHAVHMRMIEQVLSPGVEDA